MLPGLHAQLPHAALGVAQQRTERRAIGVTPFGGNALDVSMVRAQQMQGPKALMAEAPELFAGRPSIEPIDVLGLKNPGAV